MKKKEPSAVVAHWLDEIKAAKKRETDYRKHGKEIQKIYEADNSQPVPFNILYSNTETLLPALFSAIPRPVVERRFKDDDPMGKLAALACKRMGEFLIDTNREGYETFGESMEDATMDSLLPGRGGVTVKYDATFKQVVDEPDKVEQSDEVPEKADAKSKDEPVEYADNELVCTESIVWDRVYYGYAKKWSKVPWIAYEFYLTKAEVESLIDAATAAKLTYTKEATKDEDEDDVPSGRDQDSGPRKTACVYQIWDKDGGKTVKYLAPSYKDGLLKEEDDPLGLTGFFNTPRPLQFVKKSSNLVPTAPYLLYKTQAQELNRITKRINKIVEAIKARGAYDGALGTDLGKIFDGDDNTLIAAENSSGIAAEKGFGNAIWMVPVEVLISVLQQLYQARESCKQVIYEITGISDILRGTTQASETATAQTIKNQWGTLRLKRMQREVARYARDLLRLMLELAATKFSEETWAKITGLPFVTTEQRQQLEQQAAVMQMMGNPIDQALQSELAKPVWGQILELLRDDFQRSYRIDIETNSTVEPEAAEDQKAITELLTAIGQTLNGLAPLVQSGSMPFQAAQSLLLFIARRFRYGSEIEDSIQQMQPPKPPEADKGKEMEAMQKQAEMEKQQAIKEIEHEKKKSGMELKEQSLQSEFDQMKREMDLERREMKIQLDEEKMAMREQAYQQTVAMQEKQASNEFATRQKQSDLDRKAHAMKTEKSQEGEVKTLLSQVLQRLEQLEKTMGRAA